MAPVFPNTFTGPPGAAVSPNIIVFDPNMQRPSVRQGDLVFEHDLGSNTVLSAAYLFSAGHDLPTFVDVNLPVPTSRTYTIVGGDFDGQTLTVSPFFGGRSPRLEIWRHHGDSEPHRVEVPCRRRAIEPTLDEGSPIREQLHVVEGHRQWAEFRNLSRQ